MRSENATNCVAVLLTESKANTSISFFHRNGSNMKLLWSGLKSISSNKNLKVNIISKLNDINGSYRKPE